MASAWQTLEEGALTLGISSRTLHRRIARGEIQTRLQNGRREVFVEIPDPPAPPGAPGSGEGAPALSDTLSIESTPSDMTDDVGQTMLALSEDRIRRTDLAIMAYQQSVTVAAADARRTRTSARVAWSITGTLVAALFIGGLWATHRLTEAQGQVDQLSAQVRSLSATTVSRMTEADRLRDEALSAKVLAARAEGELSATRAELLTGRTSQTSLASPTTRPEELVHSKIESSTSPEVTPSFAPPAQPTSRPSYLLQRLADILSPDSP